MTPLDQLRFVGQADVYKTGTLSGNLKRMENGEVQFEYVPSYAGEAIAFTLPLGETFRGTGLPAFFAGLLPEGHRLSVLQKSAKTSLDDELTLLLGVGHDVPGDVQVVPQGQLPEEREALVTSSADEWDFLEITGVVDSHAIPGEQPKASAFMVNMPVPSKNEQAILKIDPPDHPHLVENEALHLAHAQALKIPVARARTVADRNGVPGLWVTRFDRVGDGDSFTRLATEDAAQVMGVLPARKYTVDAETAVAALAQCCSSPRIAARNLYLQFLFAWLTGNGDLHAKNISILRDSQGRWNVAPLYDIPCTALYQDMTMALPIAGRVKGLFRRHWLDFADSIDLPQAVARSSIELALRAASAVDLNSLPFSGSPLKGAERELRNRRLKMES
ncbi:type II toxin-antitoxin system HipA family toxin [Corynebacterium liangguodongii]|uniref:Type II toxin-antitoxin system HipA family toxin n=1 Tax=Corynebacterium liangguodongii TaxID=2079535 RepID=A0A2S0WEM0_9CORY|nr:HipA domain-containing protein [Corynebacterium liangguodongii]AWB84190.1 type II toxin-antitoxin system HipA family toxin [Corynebacterium liangguodongii]PWC00200.1 type II toxin-antitoxin system HipA family toxin [Corynebacterium liangguodongii]